MSIFASIPPSLRLASALLLLANTTLPGPSRADSLSAMCAALDGGAYDPVLGPVIAPSPAAPRPERGVPLLDPAFGTCLVRATDHANEPPSGFARNDYSRRQAFNADRTRFLVYALDGHWHLYDAENLSYVRVLPGLAADAEPQWHPTDPRRLYFVPTNGGLVLQELDVVTGAIATAADFSGTLPWDDAARVWTRSEGSPSADGRYWCFQAETAAFAIRGVFVYDLTMQQVVGTRALAARPDHVSMSASGRWCVVSHLAGDGGTVAWNRTFTDSLPLHHTSEHSDLAFGASGDDMFVFVDYQSNDGDLLMVNLDTGERTALFPTYIGGTATAYHVSGKSFARPGWVLLSTYADSGPEKWLHRRILAVELVENPRLVQLAHHHSEYNGYWTEPHASVSRDFSRVLFSSNWGSTSDTDVDAYMIRLPSDLAIFAPEPGAGLGTAVSFAVLATVAGRRSRRRANSQAPTPGPRGRSVWTRASTRSLTRIGM